MTLYVERTKSIHISDGDQGFETVSKRTGVAKQRFFSCPKCAGAVRQLFYVDTWACKYCHNLRHNTCSQGPIRRQITSLIKARQQLGASGNPLERLGPRRSMQPWDKYARLTIRDRRIRYDLSKALGRYNG